MPTASQGTDDDDDVYTKVIMISNIILKITFLLLHFSIAPLDVGMYACLRQDFLAMCVLILSFHHYWQTAVLAVSPYGLKQMKV